MANKHKAHGDYCGLLKVFHDHEPVSACRTQPTWDQDTIWKLPPPSSTSTWQKDTKGMAMLGWSMPIPHVRRYGSLFRPCLHGCDFKAINTIKNHSPYLCKMICKMVISRVYVTVKRCQTHWKASNTKPPAVLKGHAKNSRWRTACLAMEEMHTTYGSLRSCFLRRLKVLVWDGDEIQIDSVSEKMCPLKTPMKFKHCPAKSPIIQEGRTCSRRGHHQWGLRWFALSDSFTQVGHLVPVNDWYHTCKFTGHVVFMGSSKFSSRYFWKQFQLESGPRPSFEQTLQLSDPITSIIRQDSVSQALESAMHILARPCQAFWHPEAPEGALWCGPQLSWHGLHCRAGGSGLQRFFTDKFTNN